MPEPRSDVVQDVLRSMDPADRIATEQRMGPRLGQDVEVVIRTCEDLPPRLGEVKRIDEDGRAYVTNAHWDLPPEYRRFAVTLDPGAWDLADDDQVYAVRVVAPVPGT